MQKLIKRYKKGDSLTIYDGGDGKYYTDQTYSTPFAPSGVSSGSTNRTTFTDGMSDEAENGLKWGSLAGIPGAILGWGVGSIIGKIRDKRAQKIVNQPDELNNGNTSHVANTFSNENRNGKNTITQNDIIADQYIQDQMNGTNIREQQAMKNAYDNTKSNYNENNQDQITITKDYDYLNEDKALAKIINDRKKEQQGLANTYASPMIGKSGIKIKKKNEGKFTDYCGGEVTQDCINKAKSSGNKKLVKRATFAENARKWKHQEGGKVIYT